MGVLIAGVAVWVLRTPVAPDPGSVIRFSHLLEVENFARGTGIAPVSDAVPYSDIVAARTG